MKVNGGIEQSLLTSQEDGGEWAASHLSRFTSEERVSGNKNAGWDISW
jgi:hypothetical protein